MWLNEYSTGIRSAPTLTESSLCGRIAPEPACLPMPRWSFVWLAFLLFIPLPFRFLSLQLTRGMAMDSKRWSERGSVRKRQIDVLYSECGLGWGWGDQHVTDWDGSNTELRSVFVQNSTEPFTTVQNGTPVILQILCVQNLLQSSLHQWQRTKNKQTKIAMKTWFRRSKCSQPQVFLTQEVCAMRGKQVCCCSHFTGLQIAQQNFKLSLKAPCLLYRALYFLIILFEHANVLPMQRRARQCLFQHQHCDVWCAMVTLQ